MYSHPNQSYPGTTYRPTYGYQCPPADLPALPSLSTVALQDIVEGQQRATNGLVSLLSQERTTTESNTREHKQQLSNLTSLTQHFLTFMPDVEQKFLALENSIRTNCSNSENAELQGRVKDMVEVVANLGRIAEGLACSTGLRLVPSLAPNPWAWASTQPLQQDPTSFSASFTHAPRLFPAAIPNSSRSSVFAHSTGPTRSVHWPSDLDAPTTSWSNWSDPNFPVYFGANTAPRPLRSSQWGGGGRAPSVGAVPSVYSVPPFHYAPTPSDSPIVPSPGSSPYGGCRMPFCPPDFPTLRPSPPLSPVPRMPSTMSPSTESSMPRRSLSPISERTSPSSAVPTPPAFGRNPANGPSPSTSSIDTFSTPSRVILNPPPVPQSRFSVSTAPRSEAVPPSGQMPPNWFGMVYPRPSTPTASTVDDFTIPSPTSVAIPNLHPVDTFRWSSLFPSAPIVGQPAPESNLLLRSSTPTPEETVSSPMSSPARSVISYATTSEPLTPLSRVSGEISPAATPNKPTTDKVASPKATSDEAVPQKSPTIVESTTAASTSNAIVAPSPSPPRNPLAIQLVSFFFDTIQRLFKVPDAVDLSYGGFEVTFATDAILWTNPFHDALYSMRDRDDENNEDRRMFELMPLPANAALHRYVKDLARVRMDLAALQAGEDKGKEDPAVEQLMLRAKAEQETAQSWMRRVSEAAGALSIADPAFSPRK